MANITVADVRAVYQTPLPDAYINAIINSIYARIGLCLAGYDDDTAYLIAVNLAAYLLEMADGSDGIASHSSPNGASISYKGDSMRGLSGSSYGRLVISLDSHGCHTGLVTKTAGMVIVGPRVNR